MTGDVREELLQVFSNSIQPPYNKGIKEWCEENIILPPAYAIHGKLDLSISPYLHQPLMDLDDPTIKIVNLIMATQIGKSLASEIAIPYWVINQPGPVMRLFHNNDISNTFAETRLIPLLKNCEPIKPLLKFDRFATKKTAITLPHMSIIMKGANDGVAHGLSIKYLLCDEVHQWEIGMLDKFIARTTAFAGRRKILITSQPNEAGSDLERVYNQGRIYEWQWCCQNCKNHQPFYWNKQREDGTYAGFNWDTVLNPDGETTNIALSAKTTWLECFHCKHKVTDSPANRVNLNTGGKYVCIKNDGAADVVSYTAPNFVNINLSFESAAAQYMLAKRIQRQTGLDEQMKIFVNQVLGRFYLAEQQLDISKLMCQPYDVNDTDNKDWLRIMTVDVQRNGSVKYYVVWAYHRNGNESRRIDFGIARTWDEIEQLRLKHKVLLPCVGIDSGDDTDTVYQECIKHGTVVTVKDVKQWVCWTPMKGDAKPSFKHRDGITRYFAETSPQDAKFPLTSKYRGIPAPLMIWSSTSVKYILAKLRDNQIDGIKWLVDKPDNDFDSHLFSEGLMDVVDKRTGLTVKSWKMIGRDNHYLDCCAMNLTLAMKAGVFSPTKVNEDELKRVFEVQNKPANN